MLQETCSQVPDIIFYNGTIYTMEGEGVVARALAVKDGKILATYSKEEAIPKRGFGTRMVDLQGKTVLPGFIDCNVHLMQGGLEGYCIEVYADTKEDFLQGLSRKIALFEEEAWIWCVGYNETMGELTRWELDRVTASHPVIISKTEFQESIVNTLAYRLLQIPRSVPGVQRNEAGKPTGILKGEASGFARRTLFRSLVEDRLRETVLEEMDDRLIRNGITTANVMEGGPFFADEDIAAVDAYRKRSKTELLLFPQTMEVSVALERGLPRIGGNLYLDGSIGSRTAAIEEPYEGEAQNGILYYSQEDVNAFVLEAHEKGLQIALSCIGTRAIEQALCAFENAFSRLGRGKSRHRLELFVYPTREQIKRAAGLGLIFSMRPNYDACFGGEEGEYWKNMGKRALDCNPLAGILQEGGLLCCGSEHSVTPLNPFVTVASCLLHHNPAERLTVYQALESLTKEAAYANFAEDRIGKLSEGYEADLVVVSADPFVTKPQELQNIETILTMKKGKILFYKER